MKVNTHKFIILFPKKVKNLYRIKTLIFKKVSNFDFCSNKNFIQIIDLSSFTCHLK